VTLRASLIVTLHASVPEQAPLQPANWKPWSGVAVRATAVPLSKEALQVAPQSIPAGELVTLPLPPLVTVRANWPGEVLAKLAVTLFAASTVTVQVAVPEQAPLHPVNWYPLSGVAVRVTGVPLLKGALQVLPQSMPAGELVILPLPLLVTVSANWPLGGMIAKVAVTLLAAVIDTVQVVVVPLQAPPQPLN
jgi:hypothetical protein